MGSEVNLYLLTGKKTRRQADSRTQVQPNENIDVVWDMNKMHVLRKRRRQPWPRSRSLSGQCATNGFQQALAGA